MNIFLVLLIIIVVIIVIRYLFKDKTTLNTMQNAQTASVISASDLATSKTNTSNFAYSIWFYINDWNYRYGEPKVIFGRMGAKSTISATTDNTSSSSSSSTTTTDDISGLDPCPAVVLGAVQNDINISLACFAGVSQNASSSATTAMKSANNANVNHCNISNVPIQTWVNLIISVYNRSLDVYIDGKLVKTCLLDGIANVNSSADVYLTPKGGFDGWTSNFQYYGDALNPQEAWNIYAKGYTGSYFSNMFKSYQVKMSLVENGATQGSLTI